MGIWASKEAPPCGMSSFKLVHASRWNLLTMNTDDGSRPSSPANQTSSPTIALKTPEGITLTLHKGEIASQQVDVIVNSTDTSLQLNLAALSRSILEAGGTTLQDECERNAPDGIEYGDVVVTSGGQLMCQYVIHGAACSWADGQCKQVLGKFVANSLMEAHKKNLASIAIPALGTGGHGIPPEVSAEVMFDELCEFCRLHPHTTLRDVRFVVYPKDIRSVQAFEKVLLNRCFAMTVETAEGMKLSLCVSDLADEQADVIVNSAGEELQLHRGQASKALLERGGKTLQEQCDSNAPSGIKFGEVVVTSGGQLQSPYVVHGACCGWENGPETCKQILGQLITNSFKVVHEKTLTSIAFPAIGTGILQIPPRFVAKVMIDELLKFSHQNPKTTLEDVRFITYFTNFPAMQAFSKVLRSSCSVLPDPPPAQKDYFPLPTVWRVMDSTQYCKLDELHTASSEFQIVENLFKPKEECEIKKIERVQNPKLYRQFMVHKKDMEEHSDDSGTVERRLWHGTTKTGAGGINTYGFNRSYCGANGTLYGNGAYFAVESSYSSSDTYSAPDGNGLKRMFLARVLTGVYTKGKRGLIVPPLQPGKDGVLFDTVVNSDSRPTIFVVFNDCQAYPEYLVTFK